jgi:hypothetical protein
MLVFGGVNAIEMGLQRHVRFPLDSDQIVGLALCLFRARLGRAARPQSVHILKLGARSAEFRRIFASYLVDLVLGELLSRHAGRIAGFSEKAVQARRRDNPEQ